MLKEAQRHPLLGETVYIRDYRGPLLAAPRPMLHAAALGFRHPSDGRAMLFEEVWNYRFVRNSNLVDAHMGRLRRKVDEAEAAPMIHSVRGAGFVLHAPT